MGLTPILKSQLNEVLFGSDPATHSQEHGQRSRHSLPLACEHVDLTAIILRKPEYLTKCIGQFLGHGGEFLLFYLLGHTADGAVTSGKRARG
jgi:hypothetical protein